MLWHRNKFPILIFLVISVLSFTISYQAVNAASPGDIIVADPGVPAIFNQNPAGGVPTVIHQGLPYINPQGVTIEPSTGDIIVADAGALAIFRQNPAGGVPTVIHQGAPYTSPFGVTIDLATGDIIVADRTILSKIFRQNPAGGAPTLIHQGAYTLTLDIAFEFDTGDVIVSNADPTGIFRQNLMGGSPTLFCTTNLFTDPAAVTIEPSTGDIIIASDQGNSETSTIYRQDPVVCEEDPPNAIRIPAPGPHYVAPRGLAIEPSTQEILVVDFTLAAVLRQNPAGGIPTTIHQGLPYVSPAGVAVIPVGPPPPPPPPPVGGTMIPIDTTALLLTGAQMTAAWMIPAIVLAGAGIAIYKLKRK